MNLKKPAVVTNGKLNYVNYLKILICQIQREIRKSEHNVLK